MKKISILLIALMVVSVGFLSGCTDFEKDLGEALEGEVVAVSVYAYADVANRSSIPLEAIQVQFFIMKTGGDDFTYDMDVVNMGTTGRAICPYVGYNLHEGEMIIVTATIVGVGSSTSLTFSDAKRDGTEVGNDAWRYQWEPHFLLTV